jgi:hypothetical protein
MAERERAMWKLMQVKALRADAHDRQNEAFRAHEATLRTVGGRPT